MSHCVYHVTHAKKRCCKRRVLHLLEQQDVPLVLHVCVSVMHVCVPEYVSLITSAF